jgi:hypothetical protein
MLSYLEEGATYLKTICFSDEAMLHTCRTANRFNCRVRGSEMYRDVIQHERDSPKAIVWCAVMENLIDPFFFEETSVSGENS